MFGMVNGIQQSSGTCVAIDNFDCKCGGRAALKRRVGPNRWHRKNKDGITTAAVFTYYCHCPTCGEVTGWRFSPEEAVEDFKSGKMLVANFGHDGKCTVKDPWRVI